MVQAHFGMTDQGNVVDLDISKHENMSHLMIKDRKLDRSRIWGDAK